MIQYTIRQATQADLDCLLPLYRAAAARPDCPWDETYPDAATLQADLAEGRLFCAKDPEGRVMGAYALTFHDEGTEALTFWDRRLEPAGEVVRLLVAASCENQGLGGRLLADAVAAWPVGAAGAAASWWPTITTGPCGPMRAGLCRVGSARLYDTDFDCFEKALEGEAI